MELRQVTEDTGVWVRDDDETPLTVIRNGVVKYTEVDDGIGPDDHGRAVAGGEQL